VTHPPSSDPRRMIEVLLDLTRELTVERPLEESLQLVTQAAVSLVGADHVSIRLLDASRDALLAGARSGSAPGARPLAFKKGEGIIGWVVEHGEGALVDDVNIDDRFVVMSGQGFVLTSMIAEPLWSSGEVIGVLSVSSPLPRAFGAYQQLLVRLLANCSVPPVERARLKRLALYDDMTLAYNHRYLVPRLNEEIERARRSNGSVCILLLDLDHFKQVNDAHGHAFGDRVLRLFADRVRAKVRMPDVLVRRGGEEFVLIMPAVSDEHQGLATAARIKEALDAEPFEVSPGHKLTQTASIGVANWDGKETAEGLELRADLAMYEAKRQGRNRIVLAATQA
jgi:two-component system, cell cycle response regulator